MTKRDRQASEYAAESYEKTPTERGVSHTKRGPVAWAVFCGDSRYCYDHYDDECEAQAIADMLAGDDHGDGMWHVVPLCRHPPVSSSDTFSGAGNNGERGQPTLTDEEREAVKQAAIRVEALCQLGSQRMAATLRSLLERMK
jgi:hypothetical protein